MPQSNALGIVMIVTSISSLIVAAIGAVFAGLAMLRAQSSERRTANLEIVADKIHTNTNSGMERLTSANQLLATKLEAFSQSRLIASDGALALAMARIASLEADVVKRAEAAQPPRIGNEERRTDAPATNGPPV